MAEKPEPTQNLLEEMTVETEEARIEEKIEKIEDLSEEPQAELGEETIEDVAENPSEQPLVSPANDATMDTSGDEMLEIPVADDFDWFTDHESDWVYGIVPINSEEIDDFQKLCGNWKGLQIIYDYDGTILGNVYFTFSISGKEDSVEAVFHWHWVEWSDGSQEELSMQNEESMKGNYGDVGMKLGPLGNQLDLLFYEFDGKEYAEGIWTVQSGEEVRIALTR